MTTISLGGKEFRCEPADRTPWWGLDYDPEVTAIAHRVVYRWNCHDGTGTALVNPVSQNGGIPLPNLVHFPRGFFVGVDMDGGQSERLSRILRFLGATGLPNMAKVQEAVDLLFQTAAKLLPPPEWADLKEIVSFRIRMDIQYQHLSLKMVPPAGAADPGIEATLSLPHRGKLTFEITDICDPEALAEMREAEPGLLTREVWFELPALNPLNREVRTAVLEAEMADLARGIAALATATSPHGIRERARLQSRLDELTRQRGVLNPN